MLASGVGVGVAVAVGLGVGSGVEVGLGFGSTVGSLALTERSLAWLLSSGDGELSIWEIISSWDDGPARLSDDIPLEFVSFAGILPCSLGITAIPTTAIPMTATETRIPGKNFPLFFLAACFLPLRASS